MERAWSLQVSREIEREDQEIRVSRDKRVLIEREREKEREKAGPTAIRPSSASAKR